MSASSARLHDEARRRIDSATGANRNKKIASAERLIDVVHIPGHLPEPDEVRPHLADAPACRANALYREVPAAAAASPTSGTEAMREAAMHVNQTSCAGGLVQRVDILCNDEHDGITLALQPCKRRMGGIGFGFRMKAAPEIVEILHFGRIARETFRCRDLRDVEL